VVEPRVERGVATPQRVHGDQARNARGGQGEERQQ
jgi:hypothetical protein